MRPFLVVEDEAALEARFKRWDGRVVFQVNILILDRPPEPFDKDMVQRTALGI
jgi:hypothetical protein